MSELIIEVWNHFCHEYARLALPEKGVTLVLGRNGAGKSSLVLESQALAVFGRTLRGSKRAKNWKVHLEDQQFSLTRQRKNATPKLEFATAAHGKVEHERTTDAEALATYFGVDFLTWRRTHVFSAGTVAQFAEATDAERKRLLSSILGADKFEVAAKACRKDLATAVNKMESAKSRLSTLERALQESQEELDEAQKEVAEPPPTQASSHAGPSATELAALANTAERALERCDAVAKSHQESVAKLRKAQADVASAADAVKGGACQACGRPFDVSFDVVAAEQALDKAEDHAGACRRAVSVSAAAVDRAKAALRTATRDLHVAEQAAEVAGVEDEERRKAWELRQQRAKQRESRAQQRFLRADRELETVELAIAHHAAEVAVLRIVSQVLGHHGAPALVLEEALADIEAAVAEYLGDISPGAEMVLGMDGNQIYLVVDGFGGGKSYEELSTGERCRVDVALLLAIASVSPPSPLPLVFDDVFGALDGDGVAAVAKLLLRIGKTRRIVVVTQLEELAQQMAGAAQVIHL